MLKKIIILALCYSTNVFAQTQLQSTIVPMIGDKDKCIELSGPFLKMVLEKLEIENDTNSYATCIQHQENEKFGIQIAHPRQDKTYKMEIETIDTPTFLVNLVQVESRPRLFYYDVYSIQNNRIVTMRRSGGGDYTVDVPVMYDYKLDTLENCQKFASDIKHPAIKTYYAGSYCKEKNDGSFTMNNLIIYPSSY